MVTNNTRLSKDYDVKQISIQVTDETARQIRELAQRWGLPDQRHNTPVIERCIERVYQQELAKQERDQKDAKEG